MQGQTALTAYLKGKQLLLFSPALQCCSTIPGGVGIADPLTTWEVSCHTQQEPEKGSLTPSCLLMRGESAQSKHIHVLGNTNVS